MNQKLRQELKEKIAMERKLCKERIAAMVESAKQTEAILQKLKSVTGLRDDHYYLSTYSYMTPTVFLSVPSGTKADFSRVVRQITEALDEAPDTDVIGSEYSDTGSYVARWKSHNLHVSMYSPIDCMMVDAEVEREVRVKKTVNVKVPHPACKAALRELE